MRQDCKCINHKRKIRKVWYKMSNTLKKPVDKKIYIEVLRIIAILFVVFNHTGAKGFTLFAHRPLGSLQFWCYLFISIFCKFAVPVFFCISGALMLNREEESLVVLWRKRILKIVFTLIVFSAVYCLNDAFLAGTKVEFKTFVVQLYSSTLKYHLWYLYAYIAYLASIPFLQNMAKHLSDKYFYYMIGITAFFDLLRFVEYFLWKGTLGMNSWLKVSWLTTAIVIYPCVGYFLEHRVNINSVGKKLPILWFINILYLALSCYTTYFMGKVSGDCTSESFHNSFINSISIYLTIKFLCNNIKWKPIFSTLVYSLGSCTFGIYLLHPLIKDTQLFKQLQGAILSTGMNQMVAVWIFVLCVVICCWLVTWILKKIPWIRRVVG